MVVSNFTSLIIVAGVLTAVGCCVTPCVRGLTQRLIETGISEQMLLNPPPYDHMLLLEEQEVSNDLCQEQECKNIIQIGSVIQDSALKIMQRANI